MLSPSKEALQRWSEVVSPSPGRLQALQSMLSALKVPFATLD
jgi:hypothetical protein